MNDQKKLTSVAGRPGSSVRVGREWVGWEGNVAHPDAPIGGGGPGNFARMPISTRQDSDLVTPWDSGPTGAKPLDTPDAPAPKPAKPPPVTKPEALGVIRQVQNEFVDYKIEAEIIADGSGSGADTDFSKPASTAPSYDSDKGKITRFNGKFTFKGTIQIQTKYSADANASGLSCYGRGTTDDDVKNREITLGFHESCHRADFQAYLKANPLPDPPAMSIGMNEVDYNNAAKAFVAALKKYWADMKADSVKRTDEVGFTKSKADRTNSCYSHLVP